MDEKRHTPDKQIRDAAVSCNSIAGLKAKEIENAVLDEIGKLNFSGDDVCRWKVRLTEGELGHTYRVEIDGPDGFRWSQAFFGPNEQTPDFIRCAVRRALE